MSVQPFPTPGELEEVRNVRTGYEDFEVMSCAEFVRYSRDPSWAASKESDEALTRTWDGLGERLFRFKKT
jgi:hypothetical protein